MFVERKHCLGVLVSTPTVGPLLGSQCSMTAHVTSCGTRGGAATSQSLEPSFRGLPSEAEVVKCGAHSRVPCGVIKVWFAARVFVASPDHSQHVMFILSSASGLFVEATLPPLPSPLKNGGLSDAPRR